MVLTFQGYWDYQMGQPGSSPHHNACSIVCAQWMLVSINLLIAVTFPTESTPLTSLIHSQHRATKYMACISLVYSPVSTLLFLPEPRLAWESVLHEAPGCCCYLIEVGIHEKNNLPSLVDLGIRIDQISLLLSTVLVFLLVTDMGTRKRRRTKTSRKCATWETMRMMGSWQMRGREGELFWGRYSTGGMSNLRSWKHLNRNTRRYEDTGLDLGETSGWETKVWSHLWQTPLIIQQPFLLLLS